MPTPTNPNHRRERMTFADARPAGARQRAEMHRQNDRRLRLLDLQMRGDQFDRAMRQFLADFEEETLYFVAASAQAARAVAQVRQRLANLSEIERMIARHGVPMHDAGDPQGDDRG